MQVALIVEASAASAAARAREALGLLAASGFDSTALSAIVLHRGAEPADMLPALAPIPTATLVRVSDDLPLAPLPLLVRLLTAARPHIVIDVSDDGAARDRVVRLALRLGGSPLIAVTSLTCDADAITATRRTYSGSVVATFRAERLPLCMTLARGVAEPLQHGGPPPTLSARLDAVAGLAPTVESVERRPMVFASDVEAANFVVAAGRGAGSRAGIGRIARAADRLGAAFGVTWAVAMQGWASFDRVIGVSGAVARPKVAIVAGASGAPAFRAGVEGARYLVAIDTDPTSAMLGAADVGIVGDAVAVMEALAAIADEGT